MEEEKEKKIEAEEAAKAEAEMKKKAGFDENAVVENDFDSVFRGFVFGNQPFNLGYDMKFQTMVPKVLPRNGILRIHNINKFLRKETKSLLGHNRINGKIIYGLKRTYCCVGVCACAYNCVAVCVLGYIICTLHHIIPLL